ncbi:DNA polymerase [Floridanema fluviatile]
MTKVKKLSDSLHQRVLGYSPAPWTAKVLKTAEDNWRKAGLLDAEDLTEVVELPLPEWFGKYQDMLSKAVFKYGIPHIVRLDAFAQIDIPEIPEIAPYSKVSGWYKWTGNSWKPGKIADDSTLVIDFETVNVPTDDYKDVWCPVCAVAYTLDGGWFLWLADLDNLTTTIDFPKGCTVINHNVQYDRQFLRSEYYYKDSGNRFFDTMAAWIACRGISNQQRPVLLKTEETYRPDWCDETATNGLDAVYQFYFGDDLDKGVRDALVAEGLPFVRKNLSDVVKYCLKDVQATIKVFQAVYPENKRHRPSLISQTAQLLLGSCWLPLDGDRFPEYYPKAEAAFDAVMSVVDARIAERWAEVSEWVQTYYKWSDDSIKAFKANPDQVLATYLNQVPLQWRSLDWTPGLSGKTKGLPKWFRTTKLEDLTLKSRLTPILLELKWRGEDVLWSNDLGWHTESFGCLPHPEKRGQKVTDIFAKGFIHAVEEDVLTAPGGLQELLRSVMSTINWVSLRKRVAAIHTEQVEGYPVVLPQLVVTGTITGRCADNLWQVAANPKKARIGTELKSMVSPMKGYTFVGADVDSQELWIASLLGDSISGFCGSTALGLAVTIGLKEQGSDVHSLQATKAGIKRDLAKNMVYGMVYGLGLKGCTDYLLKALPHKSDGECKQMAQQFLDVFKGVKSDHTGHYMNGLASDCFNVLEQAVKKPGQPTPVLKCRVTKSLDGTKDYQTTKINRIIQASGVDFRDMLVCLQRLFYDLLGIDGRLLMTIHDEIRTVVGEEDSYKAAYALQLAHLAVRASFIDGLGLDCIPANVAWFSAVDIDPYCLRKDPSDPQLTPSQTEPIAKGQAISPKQLLEYLQNNPETLF